MAELTGVLRHSHPGDQLPTWPDDMRIIVRREPIAVDAQVSLFEQLDGYRYQLIATNTATGQLQRLEARHRVQARVETGIRTAKDTGLARPGYPRATTRSTPPGATPSRSASTCSHGPGC